MNQKRIRDKSLTVVSYSTHPTVSFLVDPGGRDILILLAVASEPEVHANETANDKDTCE